MKHLNEKILIKLDTTQKEKLEWVGGGVLKIERNFNFNLREDRSSLAIVISGDGLPTGANILVHHLSGEPMYLIDDPELLTKEETKEGYKVFSIPKDNAYFYQDPETKEWECCRYFLQSKRIYEPYNGVLTGIEHQLIKNRLYIVKGKVEEDGMVDDVSGKCCIVTPYSDYEIIYHDAEHKQGSLIRTRSREITAVDEGLTKRVLNGELLIGHSPKDAKPLNYKENEKGVIIT